MTELLDRVVHGNKDAAHRLVPLVYDQLRAIASKMLESNAPSHTLQPTALVNEAFVKLADYTKLDWRGKAQFSSLAASAMRQILIDHARKKSSQKRFGGKNRVTLQGLLVEDDEHALDLLDLEEALVRLSAKHPRAARVVELRFFSNMNRKEIAEVVGVSTRTINTDLALAQAWLLREMERGLDRPSDA